jgi:hypothetical protein
MIIAIAGYKRSGKDSIADYLVESHNFTRYAFADPMYEMVKIMFDWDENRVRQEKEVVDPRWGISPRQALQSIGTEWAQWTLMRQFSSFKDVTGRKVWVNRFRIWYNNEQFHHDMKQINVVIPDLRFPHEAEVLDEMGAILWRVIRPDLEKTDSHESERYCDELEVNYEITNDGTLEELHSEVEDLVRTYEIGA